MRSVKKKIFIIAFFFLGCAVFHKQILGMTARFALSWTYDCQLAYRSVQWEEGEFVFSDLVLFDPTFHAHIEKAALRVDWKALPRRLRGHLRIDRPHVSVLKLRSWPERKGNWIDFSATVNDGILVWDGLAHFDLDHRGQQTHLTLDWGDSGLKAHVHGETVEAELRRFKAVHFQSFFPQGKISQGFLTGRLQMMDQCVSSAHLTVAGLSVALPLGAVEEAEGTVSYHGDLGIKWNLQGMGVARGKEFPFQGEGRGFFKKRWFESELHFEKAFCKVSGEGNWKWECQDLLAEQLTLLQAGGAVFWPELAEWTMVQGRLNGKGSFSSWDSWRLQFEGDGLVLGKEETLFSCEKGVGNLTQEGGELVLTDEKYDLQARGTWERWKGEVRALAGHFVICGGWDGEKFPIQIEEGTFRDLQFKGRGWIDPHLDLSFKIDGEWAMGQKKFPFYCPQLSKAGSEWAFDFRLARKTWDLLRCVGTTNGKEIAFQEKSHFLGAPLHFAPCDFGQFDVSLQLPWKSALAIQPLLQEWGLDLPEIPHVGNTDLRVQYKEDWAEIVAKGTAPPFVFQAQQEGGEWTIDLASDLSVQASLTKEGHAKGKGSWKEEAAVEFEGAISPSLRCEFSLPKVQFHLADFQGIGGDFEGQGHFIYDGAIESDLDLAPSALKIQGYSLENEGPIHLYYSSAKGALFQGLNLHGPLDCAVDLLEFDAGQSHWIFHNAQMHIPGSLLTHRFFQFLDRGQDLNFTADLDFASDLSTFACTMREGVIPFDGQTYPVEDLHLFWDRGACKAALHYLDHFYRIHLNLDEQIQGRLILGEEETPLTIDWEYGERVTLHSIEGSFGGVEASFHAESPDTLVGSARIDFATLSALIPKDIAEVFQEIKMGRGYELKGRLKMEENAPSFHGILSGKQLELFGFQFRTLLAQVDFHPERIRLYDLKISDTAGMMKVDEILLEGKEGQPWTIDIPQLTLQELRPSLLQRPGEPPGEISPLVVRELKLNRFKGLLDRSETYTAEGQLHFINSYKREETIFDLPANVLSRIAGLDLELLIPVCGDLRFELKEGAFYLLELANAFSEASRSEFFLEMEPPPTMDLDGNLNVFVKMKQFVLLKFTESFLISIEGQLDDPQFHLRKKRFFSLL